MEENTPKYQLEDPNEDLNSMNQLLDMKDVE